MKKMDLYAFKTTYLTKIVAGFLHSISINTLIYALLQTFDLKMISDFHFGETV